MRTLAVQSVGMVTGLGLNAPTTSAAMFSGLDNFQETRYMDQAGEWALGSQVPLEGERGLGKLGILLHRAVSECLQSQSQALNTPLPLLLCLAERERPARIADLDNKIIPALQKRLQLPFHRDSVTIADGKVGGITALEYAQKLVYDKGHRQVLLAGVDSLLNTSTMHAYENRHRLLTAKNSDGFIPGEAAAALLLSPAKSSQPNQIHILSTGFAEEQATIDSDLPLRGDGLAQAFKAALKQVGWAMHDMDFRICDINGEHYYFKEASLALQRVMRKVKATFDLWDPVGHVGEVGAAIVPVMLAYLDYYSKKGFLPGHKILCHAANDKGRRGACILQFVS